MDRLGAWHAYMAVILFVAISVPTGFGFAVVGIIMGSETFGGLSALFLIPGVFLGFMSVLVAADNMAPRKPYRAEKDVRLSREQRKELVKEKRRIAFDAAVKKAEEENGIGVR